MNKWIGSVTLFFFMSLLSMFAVAEEATKEQAISMVEKAAAYLQANGKDKALTELNTKNGQFHKGELYVFAYDTSGAVVAHPVNSALVGKNMLDQPDADGKKFRQEIVSVAQQKGTGWVDYKYKNPESGQIEPKTTYVKKVGDIILSAGIYKK